MTYLNADQALIVETTRRIFADLCAKDVVDKAEAGDWPESLWQHLETSGLTLAGVAESAGGYGGSLADALLVVRQAGAVAAPIPLAETLMASILLADAGADCGGAAKALAGTKLSIKKNPTGAYLRGQCDGLLYLQHCQQLLIVSDDQLCLLATEVLDQAGVSQTRRVRMSGEVETGLLFDHDLPILGLYPLASAQARLLKLGAVMRVNQMSGAMTTILEMSVSYALERRQFGRSLSQFQAIQQQLATLAGEVAVCQRAADSVLNSLQDTDVAVAKARVGEAVTLVADIAHQVHGAMGYTQEHGLNLRTRRLWEWRDDYGSEVFWQQRLGQALCLNGADKVWSWIVNAG